MEQTSTLEYLIGESALSESGPLTEKIYIVLMDTKTAFSKVARLISGDRYNHASLCFSEKLDEFFTFDLGANTILRETRNMLDAGARFIVYSLQLTAEAKRKIESEVRRIFENSASFSYSKLSLAMAAFNKLVGREIFEDDVDGTEFICSTFVTEVLRGVGIDLFDKGKIVVPSDFMKNKKLRFERRGTIGRLV